MERVSQFSSILFLLVIAVRNSHGENAPAIPHFQEGFHYFFALLIASLFGVIGITGLAVYLFKRTRRSAPTLPKTTPISEASIRKHSGATKQNEYRPHNSPKPFLEGVIREGEVGEILQFLEAGKKTGMLCIESGTPVGMLYFRNGIITLAQTTLQQGHDAVMELLSQNTGCFQFYQDRPCDKNNCRLIPTREILQWARWKDEQRIPEARHWTMN